jgi:hypothetical protein
LLGSRRTGPRSFTLRNGHFGTRWHQKNACPTTENRRVGGSIPSLTTTPHLRFLSSERSRSRVFGAALQPTVEPTVMKCRVSGRTLD